MENEIEVSEIDEEFKKIADQINLKLKEATVLLKEVNELKLKAGLEAIIYNDYIRNEEDENGNAVSFKLDLIKVSDFETELEMAGWSTSSSYC